MKKMIERVMARFGFTPVSERDALAKACEQAAEALRHSWDEADRERLKRQAAEERVEDLVRQRTGNIRVVGTLLSELQAERA